MSRRVIAVALSEGQLDALVAPIALYPDGLLSEILMASTYPVEVVEAARTAPRPGAADRATNPARRCRR
jgi:hypothetical protein